MRQVVNVWLVMVLLLVAATSVRAQSAPAVGLVMGYPASVGVLWHVSDGIALRPDVSLNRLTTETTSAASVLGITRTSVTKAEGWSTSLGVSGLFYLGPSDALRFYVTPRVAYLWSRTDYEAEGELTQIGPFEQESDGFVASGSAGAQYAPHERFRLFGELGLQYSRQEGDTGYTITRSTTVNTSLGLRSGVGVVIYF